MPKSIRSTTEKKYEAIVKAYAKGKTVNEISESMHVCRRTVYSALEWKYGNERSRYYPRTKTVMSSARSLNAMRRSYEKGVAVDDLAKKYHVSAPTIRSRLQEMGTELRPAGRQPAIDDDELAKLWKQGMTGSELADHFHVTTGTIYTHLNNLGLKRETKGRQAKVDDEELIKLWDDGKDIEACAKVFDVMDTTIKMHLDKLGIKY